MSITTGEPYIEIREVFKHFGSRNVLDGVSLRIEPGQTVALLGPSGGGKSTLLRLINALTPFDAGFIRVGPYQLTPGSTTAAPAGSILPLRRQVGMVFQDFQLFPHLSALENVALGPQRALRVPRREALERAQQLLEEVGLADRSSFYPHQLSGGQKQRVAIARALAMQPQGLLCDEITSALDPELKHEVLEVVARLRERQMTLVLVTHEIGFARRAADKVVVLAGGRVLEEGPPAEVLDRPRHERTRSFLEHVLA